MLKLGIIGAGNIGQFVMRNLGRPELRGFALTAIADLPSLEPKLRELARHYNCACTLDAGRLAGSGLDVVLEASTPAAARQYAPAILRSGTSMVVMSVGAFADPAFIESVRQAAEEGRSRLLLPTGAIAGLDHLRAAKLAGIDEAVLTMVKGPKSLAGAPYFDTHPVDFAAIAEPTVVFEGSAREAIAGFPQNVNVAIALSLVTLGSDRTKVRVVCDPKGTGIRTSISVRGATGELRIELANVPSPDNPRTSYQACFSALATLQRFSDHVQVGT